MKLSGKDGSCSLPPCCLHSGKHVVGVPPVFGPFAHGFTQSPAVVSTAAFLTQTVCLDDTTVKFEIWDTAGQERYHSLAPMYYRGAQAAIVVYDITNEVSPGYR